MLALKHDVLTEVKTMANLSVRKLDDEVYEQLRMRSIKHHVSMEEEARQIISQAVTTPERISDVFKKYFGATNGIDLDEIMILHKPHNPMDFSN